MPISGSSQDDALAGIHSITVKDSWSRISTALAVGIPSDWTIAYVQQSKRAEHE